jgi:hypothetical protein
MSDAAMKRFVALPDRHTGAARLSVFFALWTLALVLMHDVRVNAAPIYESPDAHASWRVAPVAPPQFDSTSMWNAIAERSDVMSGRWSTVAESRSRSKPVAHLSTNDISEVRTGPVRSSQPVEPTAGKNTSDVATAEVQVGRRIAARDFAGAIEIIDRVRAENPRATGQLRMLDAHLAIGQGDAERAYTLLLEALPDIRVSTQQHDLLAAVMVRTSRYAEAAAVYRALLTVDPANARWWAGYAVTQEKLGHHTELISAFRTLRTLAPPGTALATWADERLERIG